LSDTLHRFLFENEPMRGEIVQLGATWRTVLENHDYPPLLRTAMGELMAASALLAATLKLKGSLILQIQGSGPVTLLVVECTGDLHMRATAKWDGELPAGGLADLIGNGRCVITLDTGNGKQAYQGIVPLEGESVAQILQNYMLRSEQLDTRLWLAADDSGAAGMLLQKLPGQPGQDADAWNRASQLADTVQQDELLQLPAQKLIQRLFHQEDIRLFDAQPVAFRCTCSRLGVAAMLRMLGQEEVNSILEERGSIEVRCEFCNRSQAFDQVDALQIFAQQTAPGSETRH